jgi:hypothetical protein
MRGRDGLDPPPLQQTANLRRTAVNARLEQLLDKADRIWSAGLVLPMTLAAELIAFGVDVEKLERECRR